MERLKGLVDSDSAEARTIAAFLVEPHWQKSLNISSDDPKSAEVSVAITLATCDLSADCSAQGTNALRDCVFANLCDEDFSLTWRNGFTDEQVKEILDFKSRFEDAIKTKDWNALGINS